MSVNPLPAKGCFTIDTYMVDIGDHTITLGKDVKRIEPKAMHVLYILALHAGDTVERSELLNGVWNGRVVVEEALTRIISQLRQALGDSKQRRLIQTVPKKGYRLRGQVNWQGESEQRRLPVQEKPANIDSQSETELNPPASGHQTSPAPELAGNSHTVAFAERKINPSGLLVAISLFALLLLATVVINLFTADTNKNAADKIAVAVLPLRQLSNDEDTLYFADGLTEELTNALTQNALLDVPSRYSTLVAANKANSSLTEVAQTLAVRYLVEGGVRRIDDKYKIAVRLIDASSDRVVWSNSYTNSASSLFAIQQSIANGIKQELLPKHTIKAETSDSVSDVEAYQYYLRGNYWLMNGKTSEWFYQTEAALLKAVELAPDFAAAHGKLAYIYARHEFHDAYLPTDEALQKAENAIAIALRNNPQETNALLARVLIAISSGQFNVAQQTLDGILKRQPQNTTALYIYSELELARSNFDKALSRAEQAYQLDPLSPWINVNLAIVHFWRSEFSQALVAAQRAISIDSSYTWAHVWQAKIYHRQGNINQAIKSMLRSAEIDSGSPVNSAYTGLLYLEAGNQADAGHWFQHTASLLGDTPQARFWQGFLRFTLEQQAPQVAQQLWQELPLLENRIFSLLPLLYSHYQNDSAKQALVTYLNNANLVQGNIVNIYSVQRFVALDTLIPLNDDIKLQLSALAKKIGDNTAPLLIYPLLAQQPLPTYLPDNSDGWLDYYWLTRNNSDDALIRQKLNRQRETAINQ